MSSSHVNYSIDRGFTQSFQCLEVEKGRDRTKKFEVTRIVDVSEVELYSLSAKRNSLFSRISFTALLPSTLSHLFNYGTF